MNTEYIHHLLKPVIYDLKDAKSFYKALECYNTKYIKRVRKLILKYYKSQFLTNFLEIPENVMDLLTNINKSISEQLFFARESIKKMVTVDKDHRAKIKSNNSIVKSLQNSLRTSKKDFENISSAEKSIKSRRTSGSCLGKLRRQVEYKAKKLEKQEGMSIQKLKDSCKMTETSLQSLEEENKNNVKQSILSFIEDINEISKRYSNPIKKPSEGNSKLNLPSTINLITENNEISNLEEYIHFSNNSKKIYKESSKRKSINKKDFLHKIEVTSFSKKEKDIKPMKFNIKDLPNKSNIKAQETHLPSLSSFKNSKGKSLLGISQFTHNDTKFKQIPGLLLNSLDDDSGFNSYEISRELDQKNYN